MSRKIDFRGYQVSDFLTVLERHGIAISDDDPNRQELSDMFSDLLIEMARSLDAEQAEIYHNAI